MQAVLVMFRSDGERRSFSITRDMTVVGRREDCDLRIPLGEISRKHCRLVRDGESLRLEDLGSSNGTYLNGQRVQEAALTAGDTVQVGPVVFVLQVDGYPVDDELQPITADSVEQAAMAPAGGDNGPLTPTAQSEVDELGGSLEPIPENLGEEEGDFADLEESEAHAETGGEILDFESPGQQQPHA
ncbi:MAG: domain containing protein [Phycisphaerales bacterium]|jgi:pSer/pThr/pTyr-binding forkhead associated (FHA) protein|nr:domain containing protein [Phycisphaerales bacterium]MDB5356169.1 domain containing protein [Phycisphaerales bacterium]